MGGLHHSEALSKEFRRVADFRACLESLFYSNGRHKARGGSRHSSGFSLGLAHGEQYAARVRSTELRLRSLPESIGTQIAVGHGAPHLKPIGRHAQTPTGLCSRRSPLTPISPNFGKGVDLPFQGLTCHPRTTLLRLIHISGSSPH